MKKCLILLTVFIVVLIISMMAEAEDMRVPENTIAANTVEGEYSGLNE